MALTQNQLVSAIAERADLTKSDAKRALTALEDVSGRARRSTRAGLAAIVISSPGRGVAARAAFGRRLDADGELYQSADPYLLCVCDFLEHQAKAQGSLPSVQKARRRLAA